MGHSPAPAHLASRALRSGRPPDPPNGVVDECTATRGPCRHLGRVLPVHAHGRAGRRRPADRAARRDRGRAVVAGAAQRARGIPLACVAAVRRRHHELGAAVLPADLRGAVRVGRHRFDPECDDAVVDRDRRVRVAACAADETAGARPRAGFRRRRRARRFGSRRRHAGASRAIAAAMLATLSYGFAAHYSKRKLANVRPFVSAFGSQLFAAVALVPLALPMWPHGPFNPPRGSRWCCSARSVRPSPICCISG